MPRDILHFTLNGPCVRTDVALTQQWFCCLVSEFKSCLFLLQSFVNQEQRHKSKEMPVARSWCLSASELACCNYRKPDCFPFWAFTNIKKTKTETYHFKCSWVSTLSALSAWSLQIHCGFAFDLFTFSFSPLSLPSMQTLSTSCSNAGSNLLALLIITSGKELVTTTQSSF